MKKFLLTLPFAHERREFALSRIRKAELDEDLEVFFGVTDAGAKDASASAVSTLQPGELGCAQSHINILREILKKEIPEAIIFEDDVCFTQENGKIKSILSLIPKDADYVGLHNKLRTAVYDGTSKVRNPYFSRVKKAPYTTVAYYVTLAGAKKLLDHCVPFKAAIDEEYRRASSHIVAYHAKRGSAIAMQNYWLPSQVRNQYGAGQIPRMIHTAWFGGPIPEKQLSRIETWAIMHPDYDIFMWGDDECEEAFGTEPFEHCRNAAQKADVFRYLVLSRFGGIWVDTDMECLKPFDNLLKTAAFFYGDQRKGEPAIGILGSVPGHKFANRLAENAVEASKVDGPIDSTTGPVYFARQLTELIGPNPDLRPLIFNGKVFGNVLGDTGIVALSQWSVYPYWLNEEWNPENHPDAWAVHHWDKSWWNNN